MEKRAILKIKKYLGRYLGKTREEILAEWGSSVLESDNETLFYNKYHYIIFKDEVAFILKENKVSDIVITECTLGIGIRNILYYPAHDIQYKIVNLLKRTTKITNKKL